MADISPETAAKIHDLEVRYEENRGRYFVALASALREAGEVGRAEELLRSGLRHYPGSLSAHIVLGRCLADRGALEEATHEFRYVLSVDPQNLIALRTLGEMAASTGRTEEAARWYRELLAVDPMNKEAKDALDALASAPSAPAVATPFGIPDADEPAAPEYGMIDLAADAAPEPVAASEFGMAEPVELDFVVTPPAAEDDRLADAGAAPAARDDDFALQTPAEFGLVELDGSGGFRDEVEAPSAAGHEPPADFGAWGEISLEPTGGEAAREDATPRGGDYDAFSFSEATAGADLPPAAAAQEPVVAFDEDAADGEDVEVVTETMAELYARQGFHDRAAEVYRELIRRRGPEPGLVAHLAEAERRARGGDEPAGETWETGEDQGAEAAETLPLLETGLPGLGLPIDPALPSFEPETPVALEAPLSFGEPLEADADAGAGEPVVAGMGAPVDALDDADAGLPFASAPAVALPTGDAFVDSFAHGFAGAPAVGETTSEVAAPATAWIEATPDDDEAGEFADAAADEPAPEVISGIAEQPYGWDSIGGSHADDPLPIAGTVAAPSAAAAEMPSGGFGGDAAGVELPVSTSYSEAEAKAETSVAAAAAPVAAAPATITAYLSSLLAWRPGMPAAPVAAPSVVTHVTPTDAPSSDDVVSDAAGWAVVSSASEPEMVADEAPLAGFDVANADAADLPEAGYDIAVVEMEEAEQGGGDEPVAEPALVDLGLADVVTDEEPAAPFEIADLAASEAAADEDLPWIGAVEAEASAETAAAAGDEPAPWETPWDAPVEPAAEPVADPFAIEPGAAAPVAGAADDAGLYPWEFAGSPAPAPAADVPAAPAEEATAAPVGDFSFEDFFAAPPEPAAAAPAPPAPLPEPLPMPLPEPAPPAAAAPGTPAGGADDEEDLESFQAWLQSLKR